MTDGPEIVWQPAPHLLDEEAEREEAESAKPLANRRTDSPAEAKREMERSRTEIQDTLARMKAKATGSVESVKAKMNVPERVRGAVRDDPWRTLAIAAAFGVGLAWLTKPGKRGYDTLTKDEIDEIRAWRKERREHLRRMESVLEQVAQREARLTLRERIRARLRARIDRGDEEE